MSLSAKETEELFNLLRAILNELREIRSSLHEIDQNTR